jgi:hypothetical protein
MLKKVKALLLSALLVFGLNTPALATIPGAVYQPSAGQNNVGTLPLNCGGTAATTQQGAINNVAGSGASGQVLTTNGTNWSAQYISNGNWFGTGADGALNITSGTTSLTSTTDGAAVVKNYSSISISSGATLTLSNRCKGLILYCTGNCTINGTIKMDGLGASAAGSALTISEYTQQSDGITTGQGPIIINTFSTPAAGGAGGAGAAGSAGGTGGTGTAGTGGTAGQAGGGGGGGGSYSGSAGGSGAAGTSYCGGSGGGGAAYNIATAGNGSTNGGTGGSGANAGVSGAGGGGGGAGQPGGSAGSGDGAGSNGSAATAGGGGYLVLIVGGNLTIGSTGLISSNGTAGGNGGNGSGQVSGAGGGGAGGGVIWIFYAGTLSNSGTVECLGGAGGTGGSTYTTQKGGTGGAGGNGAYALNQIVTTTATLTATNVTPISEGGTGQASQQAALNALMPQSPSTNNIVYFNGTNWTSYLVAPIEDDCRTYLVSGSPYSDGSSSGNGTIYFGPCSNLGQYLTLDNGSGVLQTYAVSEISLSLASGFSSGDVYDLYVYNNSGTLTLDTAVWSNTTTPPLRSTDAAGRLTKSSATNELLIGAFYMISSTKTADWTGERLLSNFYNLAPKSLLATDTTSSWTYNSTTIRAANSNTSDGVGRVSFLLTIPESLTAFAYAAAYEASGAGAQSGLQLDATTSYAAVGYTNTTVVATLSCSTALTPSAGLHYLQRVESCQTTGTATYYGTASGQSYFNGLVSKIFN